MKAKIRPEDFQVRQKEKVKLRKRETDIQKLYDSKDEYRQQLREQTKEMSRLQNLLYAHNRYSLLLVFQAMDTAGKDSAIKHVMSGINPAGCQVHSFKQPSAEELDHDFLWRASCALPERGRIGIFNRSYYEEVLVVKVHPELLEKQNIPRELLSKKTFWTGRYQSILNFEEHLHRNGIRVLKFFLHLSKEEQARRLIARIDRPEKKWKFSVSDIEERKFWDDYRDAYEQCLEKTSTANSPWFVIPADDKPNARLIISSIILESMQRLNMRFPQVTKEHQQVLGKMKKQLQRELVK